MDHMHMQETVRHLDQISMQQHPYILRVLGFKVQVEEQKQSQKSKNATDKNIALRIFGQKTITSLQNLLQIKDQKSNLKYLHRFPIFWRIQIALKIFSTVHFLHKFQYYNNDDNIYCNRYHCNIVPKLIYISKEGEINLCPPLLINQTDPQVFQFFLFNLAYIQIDIQQCGQVLQCLIMGQKIFQDRDFELFRRHASRMMKFRYNKRNRNQNIEILEQAIEDLKILDLCMFQYIKLRPNIGKFVVSTINFTLERENVEEYVKQLDIVYIEIYQKLKKENLFNY